MKPPTTINVLDRHGGFTIEENPPFRDSRSPVKPTGRLDTTGRRQDRKWANERWPEHKNERLPIGDTLWCPGDVLKNGTMGTLIDYDEHSFYQTNNDVTIALYRVQGHRFPVLCWFDNTTEKRIA